MFVTSDIFDHPTIGRFRGFEWQENLLGGIDVHGTNWPGYRAGAQFILEAVRRSGILQDITHAGYNLPGERRTRPILPKSFHRLALGDLSGAKEASSVLLHGGRPAAGTQNEELWFGGQAGSIRRRRGPTGPIPLSGPPWRYTTNLVWPLDEDPVNLASDLFRLAVDIMGAEYGYHFVRDELGGPILYTHGIVAPLDYKPRYDADAEEIGEWADVVSDGRLWAGPWPLLRDLFQVNLLSERHFAIPVGELGHLNLWIAAQPGRGQLESIGQGRWLWTLTDAEMVHVRPQLNAAGLLVSCLPRIYRDLPNGGQTVE